MLSIEPNCYMCSQFCASSYIFLSIIYMFHKFDEISGIDQQQQQDSIPVSGTITSHCSKKHEQNAGNIYVITNPIQETEL